MIVPELFYSAGPGGTLLVYLKHYYIGEEECVPKDPDVVLITGLSFLYKGEL
jgi:hypothetical protein